MFDYLLSVIIITYNHELYIEKAIDSVMSQVAFFDFEVIVGDDCSTDNTQTILRRLEHKYLKKIKIIYRQKNIGATNNSYDCKKLARGKYLALLEGDDFWIDNTKLQRQVDFLESNTKFIAVASSNYRCDENENYYPEPKYFIKYGEINVDDFIKYGFLFHTSTLVCKNVIRTSNDRYLNLLTSHPLVGDYPYVFLLLTLGPIYKMDFYFSTMRKHLSTNAGNAQSIGRRNPIRSITEQIIQTQYMNEFFNGKYDFTDRLIQQVALLQLLLLLYYTKTNAKDVKFALQVLKKINIKIKFYAILFYIKKIFCTIIKFVTHNGH